MDIGSILKNDLHQRGRGTRDWAVWADWCPALQTRGVLAAGYSDLGIGYQILRRTPVFPHIGACIEGEAEYFSGGQWRPARKGDVLVAPSGAAHGSRRIDQKSKPVRMAWVLFNPSVKRPFFLWDRGDTRLIKDCDVRPLSWALQGLCSEANTHVAVDAALGQWCDLVVTTALRLVTDQSPVDVAMRGVWEQVDANLAHPWSTSELAHLAGFSETHFRRQCRLALGRSTGRQLTHLRMQRAAMLISITRDKLQTIAETVGYSDVFAFSVAFKRWSGVAPSTYRHSSLSPSS